MNINLITPVFHIDELFYEIIFMILLLIICLFIILFIFACDEM